MRFVPSETSPKITENGRVMASYRGGWKWSKGESPWAKAFCKENGSKSTEQKLATIFEMLNLNGLFFSDWFNRFLAHQSYTDSSSYPVDPSTVRNIRVNFNVKHLSKRTNGDVFCWIWMRFITLQKKIQVRILKLENTGQNRTIVSAMIDSADIWEFLGLKFWREGGGRIHQFLVAYYYYRSEFLWEENRGYIYIYIYVFSEWDLCYSYNFYCCFWKQKHVGCVFVCWQEWSWFFLQDVLCWQITAISWDRWVPTTKALELP